MAGVLLCLDSGTTAVKASAFDPSGRLVSSAEMPNTPLQRRGDRVEQDMFATRDLALGVLRDCAGRAGGTPEGLIVTGQGDGLWPLDASGAPAGRAITWLDGRARGLATELTDALDQVEAVTGSRPTAASQSLQLLWLQRHEPERSACIRHALRLKEWLFFQLTGALMAEPSALLPVWGSWRGDRPSGAVEEALGLRRGAELLPELAPVGACRATLSAEIAADCGLPPGLPVLMGPGDVQATLIGLGLGTRPEITRASVFGTSAIHACLLNDPDAMGRSTRGAIVQRFALGDGYLCFHPCFNGATLSRHLADRFRDVPDPVRPAYSGLVLHPFLEAGGERAPWTDPQATGAIFGLTVSTTAAEIAWAGHEALAFVARSSHAMMGAPDGVLSLGGGLARDTDFARFLATCTGNVVARSPTVQAGARGLAAIASTHLLKATPQEVADVWVGAPEERLSPEGGSVAQYAEAKYAVFRETIDAAASHWSTLSDVAAMAPREEAVPA